MDRDYIERQMKDRFDRSAFSRGKDYFLKGRVRHVDVEKSGFEFVCTAQVEGSSESDYDVRASFALHGPVLGPIRCRCSCPIGGHCKHVVAVLLFWLIHEDFKSDITPLAIHPLEKISSSSFRKEDAKWLRWLADEEENASEVENIEKEKDFPIYALDVSGPAYLEVLLTRLLKSGKIKKPITFSARKHFAELSNEDKEMIVYLQMDNYSYSSTDPFPSRILCKDMPFEGVQSLVNTGRFFAKDYYSQPITLGADRGLTFDWMAYSDGSYCLVPLVDNIAGMVILPFKTPLYFDKESKVIGKVVSEYTRTKIVDLLKTPAIPLDDMDHFLKMVKNSRKKSFIPSLSLPHPEEKKHLKAVPCLRLYGANDVHSYRRSNDMEAVVDLTFLYEGIEISLADPHKEVQRMVDSKRIKIIRDLQQEGVHLNRILGSGIIPANIKYFEYMLNPKYLQSFLIPPELSDEAAALVADLRKEGWHIKEESTFPYSWARFADDWYVDVDNEGKESSWFDIDLGVILDDKKVSIVSLIRQILDKGLISLDKVHDLKDDQKVEINLEDGQPILIPADKLKAIFYAFLELHSGKNKGLSAGKANLFALSQLQHDLGGHLSWKVEADAKNFLSHIQALEQPPAISPPTGLKAALRPYQQVGLSWMQELRRAGFGGILADDMGLGKTLQTISHLLLEKESGRLFKPSLIVAPTSLMGNWKAEVEKFAPSLKLLIYQGDDRKAYMDKFDKYDLILSTYPLLARDEDVFVSYQYYYCILDEAQMIKNAQAKASQVASEIKADHRLCLTGTPIENHLGELWALFHFLTPGFLGSSKQFNACFRNPIEKKGSPHQAQRLTRRVAPFILRRVKEEVAKELPPKTEIVHKIVLEGRQRDLYETIRASMQKKVRETVEKLGMAKSQIILLDALLKLRQVCCDPRLVKLDAAANIEESSKLSFLMDLLQKLIEEKRKVLLFSSFSSMLELIEAACKKAGIQYAKLVGDTKNRPEVIDSFQNGSIPLFLISLKAGGTGLNLTAADTVIHYDPWWNPAAEEQATDRAHRLGQEKPVFVYKLITEGTIEEKILTLQEKKRALIDNLFEKKAQQKFSIDENDLKEFFAPISAGV